MDFKTFDEIYSLWCNKFENEKFWTKELANKYGFTSEEAMRSWFKRIRQSRGLEKPKKKNDFVFKPNLPKVLLFDLETSPLISFHWGLWNQNIQPDRIISDWFIISWSAKWLFSDKTFSDVLTPEEALQKNDERIVRSLWDAINSADILIAHNGKGFDIPRSNTRFLYYRLAPPKYSKVIDTLEVAKKNFGFTSNSLDHICGYLNLEKKKETDFSLWKKCLDGDPKALKEMNFYNCNDVQILEDYYVIIRPWIRPHPNFGLWGDGDGMVCPNCGSKLLSENGKYFTQVSVFKSYRCDDCGALSRAKQNQLTKEERKNILQ